MYPHGRITFEVTLESFAIDVALRFRREWPEFVWSLLAAILPDGGRLYGIPLHAEFTFPHRHCGFLNVVMWEFDASLTQMQEMHLYDVDAEPPASCSSRTVMNVSFASNLISMPPNTSCCPRIALDLSAIPNCYGTLAGSEVSDIGSNVAFVPLVI